MLKRANKTGDEISPECVSLAPQSLRAGPAPRADLRRCNTTTMFVDRNGVNDRRGLYDHSFG